MSVVPPATGTTLTCVCAPEPAAAVTGEDARSRELIGSAARAEDATPKPASTSAAIRVRVSEGRKVATHGA
jgi:hypothetical protein